MSDPTLKKTKKSKKVKAEVVDGAPAVVEAATPSAGEAVDGDADAAKRERKKAKKAKKLADAAAAAEQAMIVDVPAVELPEKKKRKRDGENDESKKDKKKKRSKVAEAGPSTSTATAGPSPADVTAFLTKHSVTVTMPDDEPSITPILLFSQLEIPESLRPHLGNFKEPTPVQACAWPPALLGRDVVGVAETGSGKTLAFGIPALSSLITSPPPIEKNVSTVTVLVLAPTRELAIQTHDTLSAIGASFNIASVALFGGVPKDPQIKTLKNANKDGKTTRIICGTPGRILDLVNDKFCDLSEVKYLVLDEADRMLDKGFERDIASIISHCKQGTDRQTMMFSATWPENVRRLASTFLQKPIRVTVGSDDLTANSRVEQVVHVFDDTRSKDDRLLKQLRELEHKKTTKTGGEEARILIFALYKKEATRVEIMLQRQGYSVGALHGDLSQGARMEALEAFKNGTTGLLVATDVAARGLDIPNVGAVINYTFPLTIEDYIHRIGRTGRGGKTGKSITFFTGENHERSLAGELQRVLRESGFECDALRKFPMTIKKKEHGAYGAFFRDDIPVPKGPTKIVF